MGIVKILLLLCATSLVLSACGGSTTDSTSVSNSGLWARIKIEQTDVAGADINAELNVGGAFGTNVVLVGTERLEVIAAGRIINLDEDTDFADVDYEGNIPVSAEPTDFTVNLYRDNEPNILNSTVTLPEAFELTSPSPGDNLRTANGSTRILWSGGEMPSRTVSISMELRCTVASGALVLVTRPSALITADDGQADFNIGVAELGITEDVDLSRGCDAIIAVSRSRRGNLAAGFEEGGSITAARIRTVEVTIDG